MEGVIGCNVREGVATVVLDNPDSHNALTPAMMRSFHDIVRALSEDEAVRVLVLRGAGSRAFCAGADIGSLGGISADRANDAGEQLRVLCDVGQPVVAAIRGYCFGGGVALAAMADLRIATTTSQFGVPAVRLGVPYLRANVADLVRVMGHAGASRLLLTGARISAPEARELGLVTDVVADDELDGYVDDLCRQLAGNAPLAVRAVKAMLRAQPNVATDALVKAAFESSDFVEGRAAFLERRSPLFEGR